MARLNAFSTFSSRQQGNEELVAKLESEYSLEKDMRADESYNDSIQEFLKISGYEIHDTPGQEDVVLTRKYNDENISITFSISDLANGEMENEGLDDDAALYDEEESAQSGAANTKGAVGQSRTSDGNIKVAPEDSVSPADRAELGEDMEDNVPAWPSRLNVKVTRDGKKGATLIEAVAQDGQIIIDNVYFFPEADHAEPQTSDQNWKRRGVYAGPPFGNLDEELQVLLERYLEERGINTQMALFVPDYIDNKEQKEYLRWLNNLKTFFE
ncbi:mitochondrial glyco protein [Trichodelitschia bisporula]|uniref:Mitochondrial glyco protein n=1 Tax=Trichodelitschia bisporula TaxID=703511 RepID=A0A6G1HVH2_9PEZI|nr:mitochondrial glyco protein [Trichodelitschia bisporula]